MSRFIFSYAGSRFLKNDENELDEESMSSNIPSLSQNIKYRSSEENISNKIDRASNIIEQTGVKIALSQEIVKRAYHLSNRAWKLKQKMEPVRAISMRLLHNDNMNN